MAKIPKGSALYLHASTRQYDCQMCAAYLPRAKRCVFHGPQDEILPDASCGYYMPGPSGLMGWRPLELITKLESGYTEAVEGASCKRCEYFNGTDNCKKVDPNSEGDDPGKIDGDACCCLWEAGD